MGRNIIEATKYRFKGHAVTLTNEGPTGHAVTLTHVGPTGHAVTLTQPCSSEHLNSLSVNPHAYWLGLPMKSGHACVGW